MITIAKGNERIVCSYKTYDEQFRQLGYEPVADKKTAEKKAAVKVTDKKVEEKVEEVVEEKVVEENKEEEKIGSKYGVRRRNVSKKEEE